MATRPRIAALARKVKRIVSILAASLLVLAVALLGGLLLVSPGTPRPLLGPDGQPLPRSLAEKSHVEIGGARLGMFVKSRDVTNPVLLYVHGGMPDYFLTQEHPTGLEDAFTVVWWEQRGSGLSYDPSLPRDTFTLERLVDDVIAMAEHVRARFGKEKVTLMGHSGGTFVGLLAVAKAPHLFHAYVGVAQMTYQLESERLAYEHMLSEYEARGDHEMVQRLRAAPVTLAGGIPAGYVAIRDDAMHELGIGTMHGMRSVVTGLLIPSFLFREYTLGEKITLWRAKAQSGVSVVWSDMLSTDLRARVPEVAVPAYFFHGVHDYTCNYALAKGYLAALRAPVKGFYTFDASAHSPMFEEPARVLRILREDVLAGRADLADAP